MAEHRVSFIPEFAVNNTELIETIVAESLNHPTSFNLSTRSLMKIPSEIGLLLRLERLGLNNNRLTSLPSEFLNLTALRYLNLKRNMLNEFPRVLMQLQRLEVLDISCNSIKRFPIDFGNLIQLRVLSVSNNEICILPKYFSDMCNLNHFRIDHNPISWPPINLLVCESRDDQSVWLSSLRKFIATNDPPLSSQHSRSTSEVSPMTFTHDSTFTFTEAPPFSDLPVLISSGEDYIHVIDEARRISPMFSPSASNLKQELLHLFITSHQPLLDPLIAKYPFLDAYLSIIFGSDALHRVANTMLLVVTKLLEQIEIADISNIERQIGAVNHQSLAIIKSLKGFLSENGIINHETDPFKSDISALLVDTRTLVTTCKSSILSSILNSDRTLDTRILNCLLMDWKSINTSFQEAISLFNGRKKKLFAVNMEGSSKPAPPSSFNDTFSNLYIHLETLEKKESSHLPMSIKMLILKSLQLCGTQDLVPLIETLGELLSECKRIEKKSILETCFLISTQAQLLINGAGLK